MKSASIRISRSSVVNNPVALDARKQRRRKAFSRSPYAERTRMLRLPVSLIPVVRQMMERRKAEVAAGDPDDYF